LHLLREQGVVVDVAEIAIARAPFAGMLKTLDVALCGLDDAQLRHICEACPSLVRLVLAGNPGLTDPAPLARCTMVRWESVFYMYIFLYYYISAKLGHSLSLTTSFNALPFPPSPRQLSRLNVRGTGLTHMAAALVGAWLAELPALTSIKMAVPASKEAVVKASLSRVSVDNVVTEE
jgi:hypothetical protein